jgi:hypothetical protein
MIDVNTPRVLKGRKVVDVQRNGMIDAHGLEQGRYIPCRYGVSGLTLAILPRIAQIGNHGCDTGGRCVTQRAEEEQQTTQLVVDALMGIAIQGLNDKHVLASNTHQGPGFVLSVFEFSLFVQTQRSLQMRTHLFTEVPACIQGKHCQVRVIHRICPPFIVAWITLYSTQPKR